MTFQVRAEKVSIWLPLPLFYYSHFYSLGGCRQVGACERHKGMTVGAASAQCTWARPTSSPPLDVFSHLTAGPPNVRPRECGPGEGGRGGRGGEDGESPSPVMPRGGATQLSTSRSPSRSPRRPGSSVSSRLSRSSRPVSKAPPISATRAKPRPDS